MFLASLFSSGFFFHLHELMRWIQLVVQICRRAVSSVWSCGEVKRLARCSAEGVSAPRLLPRPCSRPTAPCSAAQPVLARTRVRASAQGSVPSCTVRRDWFSKMFLSLPLTPVSRLTHLYLKPGRFLKGRPGFISERLSGLEMLDAGLHRRLQALVRWQWRRKSW